MKSGYWFITKLLRQVDKYKAGKDKQINKLATSYDKTPDSVAQATSNKRALLWNNLCTEPPTLRNVGATALASGVVFSLA